MQKLVLTMVLVLVACAPTPKGHPFHLKSVNNFVTPIYPTRDFMVLKEWVNVLHRQPVEEGHKPPTYTAMKEINNACNMKPYARTPLWVTAKEFAKAKSADCKGFAVCKYYALRKAGFTARQLNLWSGDYNGVPHLVLAVQLATSQYVLDIGSESNLPLAKDYFYRSFQPSYRFNEWGWKTE